MEDLWRWSAGDLADAIRRGGISAREAVESCLARIDAVNPKLNAIVHLLAGEARAEADAADAAVKRGDVLGPLHGVPVTIKINVDQRGCATTNGVRAFADLVATEDSPQVANWRKAGAIIVGRTNTPAFSHRWFTDNEFHGDTFNPRRSDLTAGGSSGGAASAVASGMGALAHGNDFGGSIRYPAYACGVVGLRPTPGRVPAYNGTSTVERPITAQLMSVQGPLARSVADLRIGLAAMAAGDLRDGSWIPAPLVGPAPARPIRAAIVANPFNDCDPRIVETIRRAGRWLEAAGYAVEEVAPPGLAEAADMWHALVINDERRFLLPAIEKFGDAACRHTMEAHLRYAPKLDDGGILTALDRRLSLIRGWQLFMEKYPVIVMPVSHRLPFARKFDQESMEAAVGMMDAQRTLLAIPVLGFPALAVPTGLADGTPLGVQVVAQRFREDLCCDAAEIIEVRANIPTPVDPKLNEVAEK